MLQNLQKLVLKKNLRSFASAAAINTKETRKAEKSPKKHQPIISCKRKDLNLNILDDFECAFGTIPLASEGWLHNNSKGDHFTINAITCQKEIHDAMVNLQNFLHESPINFGSDLLENLKNELEIDKFTEIQVRGIPKIMDCTHTLIAAETGCGKTLTYLLPIIERVLERKRSERGNVNERKMNTPLAVVISPGRELSAQIGEVATKLGRNTNLKVKVILGGNTKRLMLNPDFEDVDVLVATIGALSKLVTGGVYRMDAVRHVVLDEADTLLDDSFTEKLVHFLKRFPFHKNHIESNQHAGTQLILVSATMPRNIEEHLRKIIDVQTLHAVTSPNLHRIMYHVEQKFLRISKASRPVTLLHMVKTELIKKRPLIIFSNKSVTSDYVSLFLNNSGVNCLNLNGDMLMKIRAGRFERFQNGECDVLSTTDIGSRGLDTTRARSVVNFEFPLFVSDYIHRCGRMGRVGNYRKCLVTNFISSRSEINVVQQIEHAARTGGIIPNVNANIKNLITKRVMKEMNLQPNDLF